MSRRFGQTVWGGRVEGAGKWKITCLCHRNNAVLVMTVAWIDLPCNSICLEKWVVQWWLFPQLGFCCAACGCVCSFQLCANDILDGVEDLIDGISHLPEPDKTLHPQDAEPQHNSGHGDEEGERSDCLWNLKHQHLCVGKKIYLSLGKHRQSTTCYCFKS